MNFEQIKKADFAAREPGIPLFWHILRSYAGGNDFLILAKSHVSEYYYLNESDFVEIEEGYNTYRKIEKVKQTIEKYKNAFKKIEEFSDNTSKINFKALSNKELKEQFHNLVELFLGILKTYSETEDAKFKKIEKQIHDFLEHEITDKDKKQEIFLKLTSNEKNTEDLDEVKVRILKELNANEEIYNFIFAVSKLSPLRLELKDKFIDSVKRIFPLLMEIALRNGLSEEELFLTDFSELQDIFNGKPKPTKEIYLERSKGYGVLEKEGKKEIIVGKDFEDLDNCIHGLIIKKDIKEIHGRVAMNGKVIGRVKKLINHDHEWPTFLKTFEKGDILVTGMTQPNMTILADKIAAIITDEGGITCHAAVISREFGIPCIVGTKISTKVLENNDLIEVNADEGIIRIIK